MVRESHNNLSKVEFNQAVTDLFRVLAKKAHLATIKGSVREGRSILAAL